MREFGKRQATRYSVLGGQKMVIDPAIPYFECKGNLKKILCDMELSRPSKIAKVKVGMNFQFDPLRAVLCTTVIV